MSYTRKTADEWTIQGHYGQGWEDVSAYDKRDEARADLKAYRLNQPKYAHRLIKRRVPIELPKEAPTCNPYGA